MLEALHADRARRVLDRCAILARLQLEATLGDRFEIKAFHDTVLGSGSLSLATLDRVVGDWLAASA